MNKEIQRNALNFIYKISKESFKNIKNSERTRIKINNMIKNQENEKEILKQCIICIYELTNDNMFLKNIEKI